MTEDKELEKRFKQFIKEEGGRKEIKRKQKKGEKEIKEYLNFLEKNRGKSYKELEDIHFFEDIDEHYVPSCCIFFLGSKGQNWKTGHLFDSFKEEEVNELKEEGLIKCKQVDREYYESYEGLFVYYI